MNNYKQTQIPSLLHDVGRSRTSERIDYATSWILLSLVVTLSGFLAGCHQTGAKSQLQVENRGAAAVDIQLAVAESLESQGKIREAIAAYALLADKNQSPTAVHRLGVLHDQIGEFDKANLYYDRALKLLPQNADLWCDIGYSHYLQGKWESSQRHLNEALAQNPQLARAQNNMALLMVRMNRNDEAFALFRTAAEDAITAQANFEFATNSHDEQEPISPSRLARIAPTIEGRSVETFIQKPIVVADTHIPTTEPAVDDENQNAGQLSKVVSTSYTSGTKASREPGQPTIGGSDSFELKQETGVSLVHTSEATFSNHRLDPVVRFVESNTAGRARRTQ